MKLRMRKRLGLVIATALFIGLNGASALAIVNTNNEILNGTYKAIGQDAGFSQGEGWLNSNLSGDSGTLTFDGAGGCTATFGGSSFWLQIGIENPTVYTDSNEDPTIDCTYDVNDDGTVSLTHPEGTETFWTNPNGTVILSGGAEEGPGDQVGSYNYDTNQFMAVKIGAAGPKGTFHAISQDAGFWQGTQGGGVSSWIYGNVVTFSFVEGTGDCNFSFSGKDFWLDDSAANGVGVDQESETGTCTYTTPAAGVVNVTLLPNKEKIAFLLGSNGNVILQGGATTESETDGTDYVVSQMVAVKAGSTMTNASLQGTFHIVSQDTKFWSSTGGASVNLYGNNGTLTFNGAGICGYAVEGSGYGVSVGEQTPTVNVYPEGDSGTCSYTVAPSGAVTLTHQDGNEKFWLSADGTTLISGGARIDSSEPQNGTGYEVNQMLGVKIDPYIGLNAAPGLVTVPAVDPDGNYPISWEAAEEGVTYVLEEAKDSEFLTGKRTAYRGKGLSASITLRPKGQSYYYRVRSERAGYAPSEWTVAGNSCNVGTPLLPASITVPVSDADGSYTITWKASLTPGVTYVVDESTTSDFLSLTGEPISVTDTFLNLNNSTGTTYFYRIKVQKDGFEPTESAWKKALNPCKVGLLPPTAFTVPLSAGTSYDITWAASLTSGVTYNLQEATDKAFTLGLRNVLLPAPDATSVTIINRKVGKTYYYRVRAVKPNYSSTPWLKGANGCKVGSLPE